MHRIPEAIGGANLLYYDAIAADYDDLLNHDVKNRVIRDAVAKKFLTVVKGGHVLDFGGGTGRDFSWLFEHKYPIVFCEPSRAMRRIAMDRKKNEFPDSTSVFLDDEQADFRNWTDSYPFSERIDAVLANFAVINCIPDIGLLFEKIALALKPGGQVVALILDDHLIKRLRSNTKGTILSFFSGKPVNVYVDYKNQRQEVYLYSVKTIRKVSRQKFDLIDHSRLKGYGFRLIHLMRK